MKINRLKVKNDFIFQKIFGQNEHKLLERLGSLDEVKRYYEAREMAIHDEITRITGARAEGEAEGIIKGKSEEKLDAARKMLAKQMPEELIGEITGLLPEEIKKLKAETKN